MVTESLIQIGHSNLKKKSKIVRKVHSKSTRKLVKDLLDSMRHHGLVGLAAPQIGVNQRVFTVEVRKTKVRQPKGKFPLTVFLNPEIIWVSKKEVTDYEGCGSVVEGNLFGPVKRPEKIIVSALNKKGQPFRLKAEGLLSRIIQHENDHLEGRLFLERVTDIKKLISRSEYLKKLEKT
jgi:peptide deformylase